MAKEKKNTNKRSLVLLYVLCGIILVLAISLFVLNKFYYVVDEHSIDYLKFETINYVVSEADSTELKREDGKCSITMSSRIEEKVNLHSMGEVVKINGAEWAKQEFEKGISWMSYHKNTFYIIQMFGENEKVYKEDCKKEFDKIKDTFTFMKHE